MKLSSSFDMLLALDRIFFHVPCVMEVKMRNLLFSRKNDWVTEHYRCLAVKENAVW